MSVANRVEYIATALSNRYPQDPRIREAIPVVQEMYTNNFFPSKWTT